MSDHNPLMCHDCEVAKERRHLIAHVTLQVVITVNFVTAMICGTLLLLRVI